MKIGASSVVAKVYIWTGTEDSFNTEQEEKEDEHWFHSSNVLSILASLAFQVIRERKDGTGKISSQQLYQRYSVSVLQSDIILAHNYIINYYLYFKIHLSHFIY